MNSLNSETRINLITKQLIEDLSWRIRNYGFILLMGIALWSSCSQEQSFLPDDEQSVMVCFVSSMDRAAVPISRSATGMNNNQEFTGVTVHGTYYLDSTSEDGFNTRIFYPGVGNKETHTAGKSLLPQTRTINKGNEWIFNDEIGIFMITSGEPLSAATIAKEANNRKYHTTTLNNPNSQADFQPAANGETIYYPEEEVNVDFIAYYPYGSSGTNAGEVTTDFQYKVTLTPQTTADEQAKIDLLYSNNATDKVKTKTESVNLEFNHALSKLIINLKRGTGMENVDFSGLKVAISGVPTTADFSLADGKTFNNLAGTATEILSLIWDSPSAPSYAATSEALLIPQSGTNSGRRIVFTIEERPYIWELADNIIFEQSRIHTYEITVNKTGITIANPDITPWEMTTHTPGELEGLIETVKIVADKFTMGSPAGEGGREPNEEQHEVTLTEQFYMSRYPVTSAQYAAFLNAESVEYDSYYLAGTTYGMGVYNGQELIYTHERGIQWNNNKWIPAPGYEDHPVIYVSWHGADAYAQWAGGSLPTEAQWEYACCAGTSTAYSYGNTAHGDYMWYASNSSESTSQSLDWTKSMGQKQPNPWGLYDMHGNVFEWCLDWYDDLYGGTTPDEPATNPKGPDTGKYRVVRGGCWNTEANTCRSAARNATFTPDDVTTIIGFRIIFIP